MLLLERAWLAARNGFGGFGGSGGDNGFPSFTFGAATNASNNFFRTQTNSTGDQNGGFNAFTNNVFQAARFAAAKSIRTSTIILAVFNTIAAFATFAWILYDSRQSSRRLPSSRRARNVGMLSFVSSPDIFPVITSGAITIQGIIFAVSQSTGLDGFNGAGCTLIARFMLPAILLVPTTQFVLGCELALRGTKPRPFPERTKWTLPTCLSIIALITIINLIVAGFVNVEDRCFKSLFWFIVDYSSGIFVLLTSYTVILIGVCVFVWMKLRRNCDIETTERVNASRMIYFLALAVLSNAFMLPFFFVMAFMRNRWNQGPPEALNLSLVASVVATVSGLMTGGLHLFLRTSTMSVIGPHDKWETSERLNLKKKIRVGGVPNSPDFGSLSDNSSDMTRYEKAEEAQAGPNSPVYSIETANAVSFQQMSTAVQAPQPVQITKGHARKVSGYSLFPGRGEPLSRVVTKSPGADVLPSTAYSPTNAISNPNLLAASASAVSLKPPPSVRANQSRHRRDSSVVSHTTVQIGLRLSGMDSDMPPVDPKYMADGQVHNLDCPLRIKAAQEEVHNLDCPLQIKAAQIKVDNEVHNLDCPLQIKAAQAGARKPTGLSNVLVADYDSDEDTVCARESQAIEHSPRRSPQKDARYKTLPPPPPGMETLLDQSGGEVRLQQVVQQQRQPQKEEEMILSPTVYTPHSPTARSKLPSPRGVGVSIPPPKKSTTSAPCSPIEDCEDSGSDKQWI